MVGGAELEKWFGKIREAVWKLGKSRGQGGRLPAAYDTATGRWSTEQGGVRGPTGSSVSSRKARTVEFC